MFCEYVWVDSDGDIRSKTRILDEDLEKIPIWSFDGSSTGQATVDKSEVLLIPAAKYVDPLRLSIGRQAYIVLCETTLESCSRAIARKNFELLDDVEDVSNGCMFGFEQEFYVSGNVLVPDEGKRYCGVDNEFSGIMDQIVNIALDAGVKVTGYNFEVGPKQAEIQVCNVGIAAADDLIVLRYYIKKIFASYKMSVDFSPKPFADLSGSGLHTNFSTASMREGDVDCLMGTILKLESCHLGYLKICGKGNEARLCGEFETPVADVFIYGKGRRDASIRISHDETYFEDRRPGANADPYLISSTLATNCLM